MIDDFSKNNAFLSNFHPSIIRDNLSYPTVEHYFQAMKSTNPVIRGDIADTSTPGKAKRAGRKAKLRSDWDNVKVDVMLAGLRAKFSDPELASKLKATGIELLIEGNYWHDNFWGNCKCPKCVNIEGQNVLGRLLMQVRAELLNKAL